MSERIPEPILEAAERAFAFRICALLNSLVLHTMRLEGFTLQQLAERIGRDETWLLAALNNPSKLKLDDISDIALSCGHEIKMEVAQWPTSSHIKGKDEG